MSQFQPGQSGNPSGRPTGSQNKRTQLTKLLEDQAEELIYKLIELAKQGDPHALRLCVERLIPKRKNEAQSIILPTIDISQPASLTAFRLALLNELSKHEVLSIDALKVIAELLRQSSEEALNKQKNDESSQHLSEILDQVMRENKDNPEIFTI